MKLLLLSNSTNVGEAYLAYSINEINAFLNTRPKNIFFIPYAAVTFSYDEYEQKVKEKFLEIGFNLTSIHHSDVPIDEIEKADCIVVGGGNTFRLLQQLQRNGLLDPIRKKVIAGIPFIGWSAGSNIACPTICTTNDMPIIETNGLKGLNLIHFQINPHYTDLIVDSHAGESRDERIREFLELNSASTVVGLREGTMLKIEKNMISLIGTKTAKIFKKGSSFEVTNLEINELLDNKI